MADLFCPPIFELTFASSLTWEVDPERETEFCQGRVRKGSDATFTQGRIVGSEPVTGTDKRKRASGWPVL
jgi:hypothetical protein